MKKIFYILSTFALLMAGFACEDKPDVYVFPKDEYFYDIPEVPVTEDYVVGVSYDTKYRDSASNVWWDGGKNAHQLYTAIPTLGEYDIKHDIHVLKQHLEWGKEAGIDFFILSWGGRGYNDTILANWENLYKQNSKYPQVVIRYDPGYRFPKNGKDTLMNRPLVMDSLRMEFDSIYNAVMTHDFAYKHKTTKVPVMILVNYTNTGHVTSVYGFTEFLRNTPDINRKLWIMAELPGRLTSPERWGFHAKNGYAGAETIGLVQPDSIRAFDAFFITDISTDNKDRYDGLYSFTDYNYRYWQERMTPLGKEYVPTIMPAFDNMINNPISNTYQIPRWDEDQKWAYSISGLGSSMVIDGKDYPLYNFSNVTKNPYQELANVAKRNVGPGRMLIIYGWNNFVNGTTLEPTEEYGNDYLKYTKMFFKKP